MSSRGRKLRTLALGLVFLAPFLWLLRGYAGWAAAGRLKLWWTLYLGLLLCLFVAGLEPQRDALGRRRRFTSTGVALWGFLLVALWALAFLTYSDPRPYGAFESWRVAGAAWGALVALMVGWSRVQSRMAVLEPARIISSREGGGFLVQFAAERALEAAVGRLPGAAPVGDGSWQVPATPEAARALLRLARRHGFDFAPGKIPVKDLLDRAR